MLTIVVYILVQTNFAPDAARTSTIIPQYMNEFDMDHVCDQPGLNVSVTVSQLVQLVFCVLCETGVHHGS